MHGPGGLRARAGPENKVWKTGQAGTGLVVNLIGNQIQIKPKIYLNWTVFDSLTLLNNEQVRTQWVSALLKFTICPI